MTKKQFKNKDKFVQVRMSETDKQEITDGAKSNGETTSSLMRRVSLREVRKYRKKQ